MYNRSLKKGILLYTILTSISLTALSAKSFVIDHIYETDSSIRQNQINHGVILDADLNVCQGKMYIFHGGRDNKSCSTPGIPTLSSFLKTLTKNNATVSLDVKSATDSNYRNTINEIKSLGLEESRFIFWVRSFRQARNLRNYSQNIKIAYSVDSKYSNLSKLSNLLRNLEKNNNYNIFMIGVYGHYDTYNDYANYIHNKLGLKVAFQIQGPNQYTQTYLNISQKADFIISDNPIDYMDSYPNYFNPSYSNSIAKQEAIIKPIEVAKIPTVNPSKTFKVEAEDAFYEKIDDIGNYTITKQFIANANEGKYIGLYDIGDSARFKLHIQNEGLYTIGIRLRSGSPQHKGVDTPSQNNTYLHNGAYTIKVNSEIEDFNGDDNSISALKDWIYWGTLNSTYQIYLNAGDNFIDIKANQRWLAVDSFTLEK